MTKQITRRTALEGVAAIGTGLWLGTKTPSLRAADSPNEKLNVAVIGVGGRGRANLNGVSKTENIIALCDVDEKRAGDAFTKWSKARRFQDFRRMFDEMEKEIDAVVVSTPDHTHFHPSMMALERGKHLYCEKPMAHSVWEIRQMTDLARKRGVATQLGVQRHTIDNMHRVVELVKGGAIGDVTEVHAWIGGDRGMPKIPKDRPPVPKTLDWDLWLGPAAARPYHSTYCPYGWRFWWDFGTGETGNWGCHILDIPFWALDLKYPTHVAGSGPPVNSETTPKSMTTQFEFPAAGSRPAVTLHWYHAKSGPPILKEKKLDARGCNNLLIGTKGMLLCGFGKRQVYLDGKPVDVDAARTVPDSPGFYKEWTNACRGGKPATCNFEYSGPLAETVILGNVAYRAEGSFEWNARTLGVKGNARAEALIRPTFRKGWETPT